jgi:hypothetical protein
MKCLKGHIQNDEKLRNIINIKITYRHNCIDELSVELMKCTRESKEGLGKTFFFS